jgi:predicted phage terminase large subunit-like protein
MQRADQSRAAVLVRGLIKMSPYIPFQPSAKQLQLLIAHEREVLFGGAVGGGKSVGLLMGALMHVDVPGYSALIIRRTFRMLQQPLGLMDLAREWLAPTDAVWNAQDSRWRFPSGAALTFGYLDTERDLENYQGAAYHFVAFDELTQFPERFYRYMFSRMRRGVGQEVPIVMRCTSNPGGLGHDWCKDRFVDSVDPGRAYIPSRLEDNAHIDAEDYISSMRDTLDPYTLEMLLAGNWDAKPPGAIFRRLDFEILDEYPGYTHGRPVRYWDLAATEQQGGNDPDWTAGVKMQRDDFGTLWVIDVVRFRARPADVQERIRATAEQDGNDVRQRMNLDPGQAGVSQADEYRRHVLNFCDFDCLRETGTKFVRAQPLAAQAGQGNLKLIRGGWNDAFLGELESFGEDPKAYAHDDQVDAASGAYNVLSLDATRRRRRIPQLELGGPQRFGL